MSKNLRIEDFYFQSIIDEESDLIPLLTAEDEIKMNEEKVPEILPVLPLRNTVLFPGVVIPITVTRDKSIALIEKVNKENKIFGIVAQKNQLNKDSNLDDIYQVGVVAKILRVLKMPDGNMTIIIQGKKRIKIDKIISQEPFIKAAITEIIEKKIIRQSKEFKEIIKTIKETALHVIQQNPNIPSEGVFAIKNIQSDSFLINFISSNIDLSVEEKQKLLEINNLKDRAIATLKKLNLELQRLELRNVIKNKTKKDLDQQQREYYLHQELKTIQDELGATSHESEIQELLKKSKTKIWSREVKEIFEKELNRMKRLNPQIPDYSIQRNYLELMIELPWNKYSKDKFDLNMSKKILDRDHFGLEKVKERIIEHIAILKLRADMKSPIICLHGPPGVGKTSLGKSIAESLGRKYVRMALGGLRDESEIRGHRRTYIGAMPGRIIQNLKKVGISNPVFVLDEIDKMGIGIQGDPSSAMLEVLDPEQNFSFYDNFLEIDYDLSKVMFIATANNINDIPIPLRDRMEMVNVSGYTVEEKVEIGKKYLLPKQLEQHGLKLKDMILGKKEIEFIITGYTRESGVRSLEKKIAKLARFSAKSIVLNEPYPNVLTIDNIHKILGAQKLNLDKYENNNVAGVVTGLAWTNTGGDILFIESILSKGKGLSITGNLGTVMKESATIALEYIKANSEDLKISQKILDKYKVHIHVPEGATPKDGPSAGITMLTSLVSTFAQKKVKSEIAMTGEITLRGKVLPVGGIKEKILAAKRANIKEILLSEANKKDVSEIKKSYLKGLKFYYVKTMKEALAIAITDQKVENAKRF